MMSWLLRAASAPLAEPAEPVPDGVAVRTARWLPVIAGKMSGMRNPAAAVTLGNTIIVHPDIQLTSRLLRHELEHVRQWRRNPISFPARYVINHLRYGYHDNPYEVEARDAERTGDQK
jgi:hypothetical protein